MRRARGRLGHEGGDDSVVGGAVGADDCQTQMSLPTQEEVYGSKSFACWSWCLQSLERRRSRMIKMSRKLGP